MKKLFFYTALLLSLASCRIENDIDQRNRYIYGAEIISLPNLQYDSDGSPPDVRVDIKRRSVNFWEFSSFTRNNANRLPVFVDLPSEILATDEWYEVRLVDEDLGELSDDEIFVWEFQALEEGSNGIIEFFDPQGILIMTLEYEVR